MEQHFNDCMWSFLNSSFISNFHIVGADRGVWASPFPYLLLLLPSPCHSGFLLIVPFLLQNITNCCNIFLNFSHLGNLTYRPFFSILPPPASPPPPLFVVVSSSLSISFAKLQNFSQFLLLPALTSPASHPLFSQVPAPIPTHRIVYTCRHTRLEVNSKT